MGERRYEKDDFDMAWYGIQRQLDGVYHFLHFKGAGLRVHLHGDHLFKTGA